MPDHPERWYTTEELAERWSVVPTTVRNHTKSGRLVGVKLFGGWRYRAADVAAFEASAFTALETER